MAGTVMILKYLSIYLLMLSCITVAEEKTWVFAVSGNRRPFNFIDEKGFLIGADLDLINAVCTIAGKKCDVTVQPSEECVRTVRDRFYPGIGLMAGWFDACASWVTSVDRVNALDFTDPIRTTVSTFTVLPGNPKGFSPKNIASAVIAHLNGAFTNQQCLTRLGLGTAKQIIVADGIKTAKALLMNGTADALFSPRRTFNDLEVLPGIYKCDINGVAMMVKKGSPLPSWWNPAFSKYYHSGKYSDMCESINEKYGGFPIHDCLPRPKRLQSGSSSTRMLFSSLQNNLYN